MSVTVSVKRRLAPVAKTIAPRWFWQRKFGIMQRVGRSDAELRLARSLCDPARVSLDIGADVGGFSIAMLESSRSVIAFEPRPVQARELTAMFDAVGAAVRVEAVALSDTPGVTAMRVLESAPGLSTIDTANALNDEDDSPVGIIEVPVKRLDDLALDDVGFVKIDVEGLSSRSYGAPKKHCDEIAEALIEAEERHHHNAVAAISNSSPRLAMRGYFELTSARRSIDEFDPLSTRTIENLRVEGGCVTRGVYVNNFVFLPSQG